MESAELIFRKAEEKDLKAILDLLFEDILGKTREDLKDFEKYRKAFFEISSDKNNFLLVVEHSNEIVATCHLTFISSLSISASKRLNVESVRVKESFRNKGLGSLMMRKVVELAKSKNVKIVQLTTNKTRSEAQNFYQKIGFVDSHIGMKLEI